MKTFTSTMECPNNESGIFGKRPIITHSHPTTAATPPGRISSLGKEHIVVETKMTRKGLGQRRLSTCSFRTRNATQWIRDAKRSSVLFTIRVATVRIQGRSKGIWHVTRHPVRGWSSIPEDSDRPGVESLNPFECNDVIERVTNLQVARVVTERVTRCMRRLPEQWYAVRSSHSKTVHIARDRERSLR